MATGDARKWWAMLGVGLGVLMGTLDMSIVNIALPTLVRELRTDFPTVQWVVLSYLLVITCLLPGAARLGDMLGRKRLYLVGLGVFTVSSLLCGIAPGVAWLIGFRALQGIGSVIMTALGTAIVIEVFPASERGRAIGIIGAVVSVGISIGPSAGGLLLGAAGWHSIFLINVPLGLLAALIVARTMPPSPPAPGRQRFDYPGALLAMATLSLYAVGMTLGQRAGFRDGRVLGLLAAAALGLAAFLRLEARREQPMIDLRLFLRPRFSLNLAMGTLVFVVLAGYTILTPFFFENVQRYGAERAGLLMAAMPILMGVIAPLSGALSDRAGTEGILRAGLICLCGGFLALSTLRADTSIMGFLLRVAPVGIGLGLFQTPNNSAVMGAAPRERLGVASGLLSLSRTLGQTTGIPLMSALFTAQVLAAGGAPPDQASPEALVSGLRAAFLIAALVVGLTALLALIGPRRPDEAFDGEATGERGARAAD